MFDFWFDLPPLLRAAFGIVLILVAVLIFFVTGRIIAIGLGAVGLAFVLFSNAGNSSGGYKF
jgi:hypothetical protein